MNRMVRATLDVVVHPVYQIPSIFMRVWDDSGQYLTVLEVQDMLDAFKKSESVHVDQLGKIDHRHNPFGRLIIEDHPNDGQPCLTIHICDLVGLFNHLTPADDVKSIACMCSAMSIVGEPFGFGLTAIECR